MQDNAELLALVNTPTQAALLADIETRLSEGQGFTIATLNLDHLVKLRENAAFRAAYSQHSHVVADGRPVVWLRRLSGRPVELVPGSDLIDPLMALAARLDVPVAFLGSTETTLATAAERLEAAHPGLRVVTRIAPPFGFDPDGPEGMTALNALAASGARVCLLALGAPKQERLAARAARHLPRCGFVSIGAGLDFIAGSQQRAPVWVRRVALEWLWRMLSDPRRLKTRYVKCALLMPKLSWQAMRIQRTGIIWDGKHD